MVLLYLVFLKILYLYLLSQKNYYNHNIRKAEEFEKKMTANNVEILILQGTRSPYINKDEARKNIELIDRISLAVFGQTGYPEPYYSGFDLR